MLSVIGICGAAGAGKTTAGDFMGSCLVGLGFRVLRIAFADPVKAIALQMGWDGVKDARGRRLLQLLGTECGRECVSPDVWVCRWRNHASFEVEHGSAIVVADDVRFEDEAAAVRSLGGVVVRVVRPGFVASDHPSERDDIVADVTLRNGGSLADFGAASVGWARAFASS